jgi:hypothetical protein
VRGNLSTGATRRCAAPARREALMLVLVVEDDEDYAEIISQTLKLDSHDVVVTGTG